MVDNQINLVEKDRVLASLERQRQVADVLEIKSQILILGVGAKLGAGIQEGDIARQQNVDDGRLVLGGVVLDVQVDGHLKAKTGVAILGEIANDEARVVGARRRRRHANLVNLGTMRQQEARVEDYRWETPKMNQNKCVLCLLENLPKQIDSRTMCSCMVATYCVGYCFSKISRQSTNRNEERRQRQEDQCFLRAVHEMKTFCAMNKQMKKKDETSARFVLLCMSRV